VTNEPSWDDIFTSQPPTSPVGEGATPAGATAAVLPQSTAAKPLTRRELRELEGRERPIERPDGSDGVKPPKAPRGGGGRRRGRGWLWALIVLVVLGLLGGGAAYFVWTNFETQVREVMGWQLPTDYEGSGNGEAVNIVINSGDIGEDIANTLHDAGVTMTTVAFYDLLVEQEPTFQPGTYTLQKEMSAEAALAALQDPANHVIASALIIEGTTLPTALQNLADGTGIPLADFQAAAADYTTFGLPAEAPSLEGYLFPATYTFDPGLTAHDILQVLVNRMFQATDAAGVPVADRHRVLTIAGLIQKEGGSTADFPIVARVFQNRMDIGQKLQSDATVSYGIGGPSEYGATGKSIFTDDDERADTSNPYNTYANEGLPVGPISAPGDAAIDAALHPADGDWIYMTLVNGETGETAFSTTIEEHDAAVAVFQQWVRDNPDWNTGG
jgi:UPF0755 protein